MWVKYSAFTKRWPAKVSPFLFDLLSSRALLLLAEDSDKDRLGADIRDKVKQNDDFAVFQSIEFCLFIADTLIGRLIVL